VSRRRIDWSGVFVVTVTPFAENGAFDDAAICKLVDLLIADGAQGIVLSGSTGEWFSMSDDEKIHLFAIASEQNRGRVKLIAGASAMDTATAVKLAAAAKRIGMDGVLLLPPPYILPTERELLTFVKAVDAVGLPIMLYNNPPRTGVNLDAQLLRKLLTFRSIVALKESAKDIHQISATLREHGQDLAIFTGIETYLVPTIQRGGVGVVAMAPNILGRQAIDLFTAAAAGDWNGSAKAQHTIDIIYSRMYGWAYNPYVVIKEAMRLLGRPGGWPRPPLLSLTAEDREALRQTLVEIGAVSA
jgi:4-hydroxy-tetrahydrodipicolinate synthase